MYTFSTSGWTLDCSNSLRRTFQFVSKDSDIENYTRETPAAACCWNKLSEWSVPLKPPRWSSSWDISTDCILFMNPSTCYSPASSVIRPVRFGWTAGRIWLLVDAFRKIQKTLNLNRWFAARITGSEWLAAEESGFVWKLKMTSRAGASSR